MDVCSNARKFVDNAKVYRLARTKHGARMLQIDIDKLCDWARK